MNDPHKLLRMYDHGQLTMIGLVMYLIEAASERPCAELAPVLPAEVLHEIRERVAESQEGGVYIWGGTLMPSADPQEFLNKKKQRWDEGAGHWRNHFGIGR